MRSSAVWAGFSSRTSRRDSPSRCNGRTHEKIHNTKHRFRSLHTLSFLPLLYSLKKHKEIKKNTNKIKMKFKIKTKTKIEIKNKIKIKIKMKIKIKIKIKIKMMVMVKGRDVELFTDVVHMHQDEER